MCEAESYSKGQFWNLSCHTFNTVIERNQNRKTGGRGHKLELLAVLSYLSVIYFELIKIFVFVIFCWWVIIGALPATFRLPVYMLIILNS
ncbi:hypothetical protein Nepgr_008711 [Nepenthes gracilis]|uniref:Uncharacterized protein n=1 Tax=Nepenthes gracilis TaxID=150966 RepID=A0AAD3XJQ3_NEPGR|nr:hypothetical protein Nepgr_008711 [Nepenthes gracilis]